MAHKHGIMYPKSSSDQIALHILCLCQTDKYVLTTGEAVSQREERGRQYCNKSDLRTSVGFDGSLLS